VVISGHVRVGAGSFLGVNVTIGNGVTIGRNCVLGAGTLLLKDAVDGGVYRASETERSRVPSSRLQI
jgi:acetyltransferase-like isoleucine patch superfamily enzyme